MRGLYGPRVRRTLPWRALGRQQPLERGCLNEVAILPEVVPIIFVPGIMGTRLTSARGMIWDPDDVASFVVNFGLRFSSLKARLRALLGTGGYQPHHLYLPERSAAYDADRSFVNLVQSSYGQLAPRLRTQLSTPVMRLCLHTPIYAFAYNWTQSPEQSGQTLASFIKRIIAQHRGEHLCDKVLLVTHSMGGLVARSAMHIHGAQTQVLGAVHAMMPLAGAPVVYERMKQGFAPPPLASAAVDAAAYAKDSMFAALMGTTGLGVSQVLGHMPGALSLLPSHLYRTPEGAPGWLTLQHTAYGPTLDRLPRRADPYGEVYAQERGPARLFDVPPNCAHLRQPCGEPSCWHGVQVAIDAVEHLHRRLGDLCHPNTHHIAGTGLHTATQAQFVIRPEGMADLAERKERVAQDFDHGGASLHVHTGGGADTQGDGTVPLASALCGLTDPATYSIVEGVEHSAAMNAPEVVGLVVARLRAMAHSYIAQGLLAGAP